MDPCHYNFPSSLICHYNSPISNRAITISHFFQTYHYVPLRRVSENLWTKIPSSSSSSHSSLFSFLPPSPWPRQIRPPRQAMWGPPPASAAPRPWAYAPRRPTATAVRRRRLLGAWGGARGGSPAGHQLLLPFLPQSTSSDGHRRRPDRAHESLPPPFHPPLDDAAGVEVGKVRAVADDTELLCAPAARSCSSRRTAAAASAGRRRGLAVSWDSLPMPTGPSAREALRHSNLKSIKLSGIIVDLDIKSSLARSPIHL